MNDEALLPPSTIFVTGATGFIGTRLVNALVAQGHTVLRYLAAGGVNVRRSPGPRERHPTAA